VLHTLIYVALLIGCCAYVARRGGPPEWIGAAIIAVGSFLSVVALSGGARIYRSVEVGVFIVDVAALLAFLVLALRAQRLWPLWITALQLVGTAGHAMKLADPHLMPWGYAFALRFWVYPMLLLLVIGTWNHQRRVARFGADRSWSSSSDRWDRRPPGGPIG
jgi:hypothetical protein